MRNLVKRGSTAAKRLQLAMFLMVMSVVTSPVFAGAADFDPSAVTAKITEYVGYGIIMLAAFILGKWTLKALGVIGGK